MRVARGASVRLLSLSRANFPRTRQMAFSPRYKLNERTKAPFPPNSRSKLQLAMPVTPRCVRAYDARESARVTLIYCLRTLSDFALDVNWFDFSVIPNAQTTKMYT